MNLIFLDIDGVLRLDQPRWAWEPICALNRIISLSNAQIVLSSTWRSMIREGFMTCTGFEWMLVSHGIVGAEVDGITPPDRGDETRYEQITEYVDRKARRGQTVGEWCILDDEYDPGHGPDEEPRLVLVDPIKGLTQDDAVKAIGILNNGC